MRLHARDAGADNIHNDDRSRGAGGLTAAELVHVLDVMGVVSSPEPATEMMRRALVMQGEDTVPDEDTVYSAQQLDEMAAFLRAPLPGQAAYRASQGRRGAPPPRQAAHFSVGDEDAHQPEAAGANRPCKGLRTKQPKELPLDGGGAGRAWLLCGEEWHRHRQDRRLLRCRV